MKNYDVPSAGSDGNYGAPTPHAANVGHQPYTAPEGDLNQMANTGLDMTKATHTWTPTAGESMEGLEMKPGGGWTEVS